MTLQAYTCAACGKPVHKHASRLGKAQINVYCNRVCMAKGMVGKPQPKTAEIVRFSCETCGASVTNLRSHYDDSVHHYCSHSCASRSSHVTRRWKTLTNGNGRAAGSFVRRRYVDECAICGWNLSACDTHRIEPQAKSGSHQPFNLILLCPNHHRLARDGKITQDDLKVYRQRMRLRSGLPEGASNAV